MGKTGKVTKGDDHNHGKCAFMEKRVQEVPGWTRGETTPLCPVHGGPWNWDTPGRTDQGRGTTKTLARPECDAAIIGAGQLGSTTPLWDGMGWDGMGGWSRLASVWRMSLRSVCVCIFVCVCVCGQEHVWASTRGHVYTLFVPSCPSSYSTMSIEDCSARSAPCVHPWDGKRLRRETVGG